MSEVVRVGTRGSTLARRQTEAVIAEFRRVAPHLAFEPTPIQTDGDRSRQRSAALDFTDRIDRALERREVELAVHSAKDLPASPTRPVVVVAYPHRLDRSDCLVLRSFDSLADLPAGATVGTSSQRRRAQLLRARPDLRVVPLRGNVDRRLERVREGVVDGAMLAVAGLRRLGLGEAITERLDPRRFVPAPGQGALAVVAKRGQRRWARLGQLLDDARTRAEVVSERAFVEAIGGDCNTPLGASARLRGGTLTLVGQVLSPDGVRCVRGRADGRSTDASVLGRRLGRSMLSAGAANLLLHIPP